MSKMIICTKCGELKELYAKEMCHICYLKEWHNKHLEHSKKYREKNKKHIEKHSKKYREENEKHIKEYNKKYRYKNGGLPMNENKSCTLFLGVHVAEQVLSKVFKDVKQMPPQNPGFDFKCSKGMKVDVKSSVLHADKNRINSQGSWRFHIKKNIIADYFLCLAFDNRNDLNPQHIWLIPGEKINHLTSAGIRSSTLSKWKEYELDINKVVDCCDSMKNN